MNILIPLQLLLFLIVPLVVPREVAAPAVAATAPMSASELHDALRAPVGTLAVLPGLPPAGERRQPTRKDPSDRGVEISAQSAIVIDRASGAILYEKEATAQRTVASLTKLMTSLVALDRIPDLSTEVTIQPGDHRGGSIEYFLTGETVTAKDLLYSALVGSSNTAAATLARASGLSPEDFIAAMDAKALELGMTSSTFADPTGLDDGNHSTAKDIAILAQKAFSDPRIADAATSAEYSFLPVGSKAKKPRVVHSTDMLLGSKLNKGDFRIAGAKTGTLGAETGYHLAIAVDDGEGHELLVVVLGSADLDSRFSDAKALAYWAFGAYDWGDAPSATAGE